jgi:hypothetical protein
MQSGSIVVNYENCRHGTIALCKSDLKSGESYAGNPDESGDFMIEIVFARSGLSETTNASHFFEIQCCARCQFGSEDAQHAAQTVGGMFDSSRITGKDRALQPSLKSDAVVAKNLKHLSREGHVVTHSRERRGEIANPLTLGHRLVSPYGLRQTRHSTRALPIFSRNRGLTLKMPAKRLLTGIIAAPLKLSNCGSGMCSLDVARFDRRVKAILDRVVCIHARTPNVLL